MKTRKVDGNTPRMILTAMICDPMVCGTLAGHWPKQGTGFFASEVHNLIASWCVRHFKKHRTPPAKSITLIYSDWAEKHAKAEEAEDVERVLHFASDRASQDQVEAGPILEIAEKHFNIIMRRRHNENIARKLENNEPILPEDDKLNLLNFGTNTYISMFNDGDWLGQTFLDKPEPLLTFPGPLGQFFGNEFAADTFVSFMASEKTGKSTVLQNIAYSSVAQRKHTAYFDCGDMSARQIGMRVGRMLCCLPRDAGIYKFPTRMYRVDDDSGDAPILSGDSDDTKGNFGVDVEYEERDLRAATDKDVKESLIRFRAKKVKSEDEYFRLSCNPNGTVSVAYIRGVLEKWASGGFCPKVVIIDYADILVPPPGYSEARDGIDATWRALRGLSQELQICLITASQANAASYKTDELGKSNFSGSKTKIAHVTAMIGLNKTNYEKENQRMRLNYIARREGEENVKGRRYVHVVGQLAIGNPWIKSCW